MLMRSDATFNLRLIDNDKKKSDTRDGPHGQDRGQPNVSRWDDCSPIERNRF